MSSPRDEDDKIDVISLESKEGDTEEFKDDWDQTMKNNKQAALKSGSLRAALMFPTITEGDWIKDEEDVDAGSGLDYSSPTQFIGSSTPSDTASQKPDTPNLDLPEPASHNIFKRRRAVTVGVDDIEKASLRLGPTQWTCATCLPDASWAQRVVWDRWPSIPMTQAGLPDFEPRSAKQLLLYRAFIVSSVSVSLATVFATDLVTACFDRAVDANLALLLLGLASFSFLEFLCFAAFVRGYAKSKFAAFDAIAVVVLILEFLVVLQDVEWVDGFPLAALGNGSHLKVLAAGRVARVGARAGKFSALRLFKPVAASQRVAGHTGSGGGHGREKRGSSGAGREHVAGQFGRRGYEDDRALYLFIREKFTDAFREACGEARRTVNRDNFTMMLRSQMGLDLEPEEEEVLYRLMTVFSRSADIRAMEEAVRVQEATIQLAKTTAKAKARWKKLRTFVRTNAAAKKSRRATASKFASFGRSGVEGSGSGGGRQQASGEVMKRKRLPRFFSFDAATVARHATAVVPVDTANSSATQASSLRAHAPTSSFAGGGSRRGSGFGWLRPKLGAAASAVDGQVGSAKPLMLPAKAARRRFTIESRQSVKISRPFEALDELDSSQQEIGYGAAQMSMRGLLLRTESEKRMREDKTNDIKKWEKSNPIKSLRLKITTSHKPLEREALVWGLQLFRQVAQSEDTSSGASSVANQSEGGAAVSAQMDAAAVRLQQQEVEQTRRRHSGRLNSRGLIELSDFEGRVEEALLVDGNHIFDAVRHMRARLDKHVRQAQQQKRGTSTSLTGKLSSIIAFRTGGRRAGSRRNSERLKLNLKLRRATTGELHFEAPAKELDLASTPPSGIRKSMPSSESEPTREASSFDDWSSSNFGDDADDSVNSEDVGGKGERRKTGPQALNAFAASLPPQPAVGGLQRSESEAESEGRSSSLWGRIRRRPPLNAVSPQDSDCSPQGSNAEELGSSERLSVTRAGVLSVLSNVKEQLRLKMREEILQDSKFGSGSAGNRLTDRLGRGGTFVLLACTATLLLAVPPLANPPGMCGDHVNGLAGFDMLVERVRAVAPPDSYSDSDAGWMPHAVCGGLVRADSTVAAMVATYERLEPTPFLLRVDGCDLLASFHDDEGGGGGDKEAFEAGDGAKGLPPRTSPQDGGRLRAVEVGYLPCGVGGKGTGGADRAGTYGGLRSFFPLPGQQRGGSGWADPHVAEASATVAGFDLRGRTVDEALYSIALSVVVLGVLFAASLQLSRDTGALTDVIVSPLTQLAKDMDRVSRFDLSARRGSSQLTLRAASANFHKPQLLEASEESEQSAIVEVRSIEKSFLKMRATIQSFAKYVPQDVVYQLVRAKAGLAKLAVEETEVTIMFTDIENFSGICERLGVGDLLLNLMSDYFRAMAEIIASTGGCLVEFIGDAILAVWNAPTPEEMHAVQAVSAALEMHATLAAQERAWDLKGYPRVRIRAGLHTARVLVGNIGAPERMKYGLLGDGVNTAARLEETNKRYGTRTLVSEATHEQITRQLALASQSGAASSAVARRPSSRENLSCYNDSSIFTSRPVDRVVFKGKTVATTLYEIKDFKEDKNLGGVGGSCSDISDDMLVSQEAQMVAGRALRLAMGNKNCIINDAFNGHDLAAAIGVRSVGALKAALLDVHHAGWTSYFKDRNFDKAKRLFRFVDDLQRHVAAMSQSTEVPSSALGLGDKTAMLLHDRCERFVSDPPPPEWDGAEILMEKYF